MITTTTRESTDTRAAELDIPRAPRLSGDRATWVVVLYQGGATPAEIATALALPREVVRAAIVRAGLPLRRSTRPVDPVAVLREVRRAGTLSLREVAARLDYAEDTVRHTIAALGMSESVRRLLRLRRRAARRIGGGTATPVRSLVTPRALANRVA